MCLLPVFFLFQSALFNFLSLHAKCIKRPTPYHVIHKLSWGKPFNTLFMAYSDSPMALFLLNNLQESL